MLHWKQSEYARNQQVADNVITNAFEIFFMQSTMASYSKYRELNREPSIFEGTIKLNHYISIYYIR